MPKKYHIAITPMPPSIHTEKEGYGPGLGRRMSTLALSALNANVLLMLIISAPSIQLC